jgi:hypothetical protein
VRPNAQAFHVMSMLPADFLRLTRRANQGHIDIIADIVKPAPGNRQRAFHCARRYPQRQFQIIEPVSLHFQQFIDRRKRI